MNMEEKKNNGDNTESNSTVGWRIQVDIPMRRSNINKMTSTLMKYVPDSSQSQILHRIAKICQHLESKAFNDANSQDEYIRFINARIVRSIAKLRELILQGAFSNTSNSESSKEGTNESLKLASNPEASHKIDPVGSHTQRKPPDVSMATATTSQGEDQNQLLKQHSNVVDFITIDDTQQQVVTKSSGEQANTNGGPAQVHQSAQRTGLGVPNQSHTALDKQKQPQVEPPAPSEHASTVRCDEQAFRKLKSLRTRFFPLLKEFYSVLDFIRRKTSDQEAVAKYHRKMARLKRVIEILMYTEKELACVSKAAFDNFQELLLEAVNSYLMMKSSYLSQAAPQRNQTDGQPSEVSPMQQTSPTRAPQLQSTSPAQASQSPQAGPAQVSQVQQTGSPQASHMQRAGPAQASRLQPTSPAKAFQMLPGGQAQESRMPPAGPVQASQMQQTSPTQASLMRPAGPTLASQMQRTSPAQASLMRPGGPAPASQMQRTCSVQASQMQPAGLALASPMQQLHQAQASQMQQAGPAQVSQIHPSQTSQVLPAGSVHFSQMQRTSASQASKILQTGSTRVTQMQRTSPSQASTMQQTGLSQRMQQTGSRVIQASLSNSSFTTSTCNSLPPSPMRHGILISQQALPSSPAYLLSCQGPTLTPTSISPSAPLIPFATQPAENSGHNQLSIGQIEADSIHAVLEEPVAATSSSNSDNNQQTSTIDPIQRLIKAVESSSPESLRAAVKEMTSVMHFFDRMAGTGSHNSTAPIGEDLSYQARCNLEGGKFSLRDIRYMDVLSHYQMDQSDMFGLPESTETSRFKRQKIEKPKDTLLDEIKKISNLMVETVMNLEGNQESATHNGVKGTIVRCNYHAIAFSEDFLRQCVPQLLPVLTLRLFVALDYPNSSPIVLDVINGGSSSGEEEAGAKLIAKVRLTLESSLRQLAVPVSLTEIVKQWDASVSQVYREFAKGVGGEYLSSKCGNWEKCVTA